MPAWTRHLGIGVLAAGLLATPALVAAPAEALPTLPEVPCVVAADDTRVPDGRVVHDTPGMLAAAKKQAEREAASARGGGSARLLAEGRSAAVLPVYRVKVQIHLIHGRHKGERKIKRKGARRLFGILQAAYNGSQYSVSENMGVVFDLKRITITRNDRWFHARPMSKADKQMKRKLHRGTAQTLNIYVNKPQFPGGGVLLGYARFPWQYAARPKLDGVTINVAALPGGRAFGYNLGDTVVHETGHWLGLLHTFEGGPCDDYNDGVLDTPKEYNPNFRCSDPDNLCNPAELALPGRYDPALNFMNYSFDACMRMFTPGQHQRFVNFHRQYRYGR